LATPPHQDAGAHYSSTGTGFFMLTDFALDAGRNEGKSPQKAVHRACLSGSRPILTTGTDVGSQLRHPLGLAIVAGLPVSLLLTLFAMPMIYLWFDRPRQRCRTTDDAVRDAGQRSAEQGSPAG
jgi:hypothetical protein